MPQPGRHPANLLQRMKKKAIPPFSLTAGQTGRLLFNFTLPEGTAKPALRGALMVHGQKVDMLTGDDDTLTIPPLPAGIYLTEVRAAGICILYGHVEVLPSPLFEDSGVAAYKVDVDSSTDLLRVNLSMVEGIPGMQGAQGEQGEKGDTGASAYQLAAQYGYAGTEAEWIAELQGAQAAANSAKASEQSATSAASSATTAQHAAEASAATAAQHATSAATDAAKLGDAALKSQNNTFSGTNTFNGVIAANGGINGLTAPAGWGSAVSLLGARFGAFVGECLQRRIATSFSVKSGNGTLASNKLTVADGEQALAYSPLAWKINPANYSTLGTLWVPLRKADTNANGKCRVCVNLCCSLTNYTVQEETMERPIISYFAGSVYQHAHYNVIDISIEYGSNGQQVATLLTPIVNANNEMTGMREQRAVVSASNLKYNFIGLLGFLIVRTKADAYEVFAVSEDGSCKIYKCGSVWAKNQLNASGAHQKLYIGATGSSWHLPTELIMAVSLPSGVYASMAAQVAQATGTPTVTDYTFEEFNAKYGITATE